MTVKTTKRHTRGSKSKAKKEWEKRQLLAKKKARHAPKNKKSSIDEEEEEEHDECVVCYDSVPMIENNILRCNNVVHTLCAHCKLALLNDRRMCPLCRGDHVKPPKRIVIPYTIKIYKR